MINNADVFEKLDRIITINQEEKDLSKKVSEITKY